MRDHLNRPRVAITGMGIVTCLGQGQQQNWQRLTRGESGIHRITRFPVDGLRTTIAGTVDFIDATPFCAPVLSENLARLAIQEALEQAGLLHSGQFPGPLFLALPPVEMEWPQRLEIALAHAGDRPAQDYSDLIQAAAQGQFTRYHETFLFGSVAEHLASTFGTQGNPISLSTACASGASAIQLGVEAIRRGETKAALCVATDGSVNTESLIRFSLLSALSTHNDEPEKAARPFSKDRDGFVMAEGSGALVLEDYDHARARGAEILGILAGYGEMADSFHRTRSSPDGKPVIGCMRNALEDAGITPAQIGYVNAHGTGTPENDKMEYIGLQAVFGDRLSAIPVSSNKSMIGHSLSAAGAVEAVFSVLTLRSGVLPPTINAQHPDPAIPLDTVPNVSRTADVRYIISNSFGFGGQNVSLVLAHPDVA